ncbi:MAG TPA: methyltransferase domain-containing protein [Burkholderiales bacterium]|nr:methyltransferase domain-containing protein [Burkholderiales bacterium]
MKKTLEKTGVFALSLALVACTAYSAQKELERTGGPYVPTPQIVVDEMLRMARVGPKDFIVDLGSGDGVIVLTAARQYKARGYGVDIDAELVSRSNAEAQRLGLADRASFHVRDVFKADLSKASVITLYLLPSMMVNLRPKIYIEPPPGTRVVSHDYRFDDWQPDDLIELDVPEKEKVNGVPKATILLWIVPAKVAGRWRLEVDGEGGYDVNLRQTYQVLDGSASAAGKALKISAGRLRGTDIRLTAAGSGLRREFSGTVSGDRMQGTVDLGGGRTAKWIAKKV